MSVKDDEPVVTDADRDAAMALLTPEERAAIESDTMSDEDQAALQAIADEKHGAPLDDDDTPAAPVAVVPPVDAPAAPAAAPVVADPVEAPAPMRYTALLPSDHAEQLATLDTERKNLAEKFRGGEIDFDSYQIESDALSDRRAGLLAMRTQAETIDTLNTQTAEHQWQSAINRGITEAKGDGIDYRADQAKFDDLDMFVKRLGADPANADKSFDWFVTEAHKRVLRLHKDDTATPTPIPTPTPAPAATTRKPPIAAIPATLALVPGGDGPGDVGNEFAVLDSLEGLDLEDALRRLTPAQRERYALAA